ncbi:hypothetical protein SNE40_011887 [Patella caerulea]|uniref:Cytochrome c oxidase subunit 5B, mitochondrial n=1 Tax=Patella caerulea TaxID=87958 RepID=A0AAN8JT62_PATCE
MAAALYRTSFAIIRRPSLLTCVRASSGQVGPPVDEHAGKVENKKVTMPDGFGHAVGLERFEMLAHLAGIQDPFEMDVRQFTNKDGTFDKPNIVPSLYQKRLVGCICEEDEININWMNLHNGEPKRCECGHWFKLKVIDPKDLDYSYVVDSKKK